MAQVAPGQCAVGVVAGNLTCTNSQTLTSSTPAQATMGATGNADITNTSTGQISAGSNASAVYAGGGLTLNNSGRIVTLAGGSNATVTANGSQTGTTTITNSGFMGDDAASGGGASNVIRSVNAASTFTLTNTASGIIKSTAGGFNAVAVQLQGAFSTVNNAGTIMATTGQSALTVVSSTSSSATINNSGSLNESGTRTFYGFVADTSGTVNFTNSGGIWGATNALWLTGGLTSTINNTSSGAFSAGSNVLLLENTRATIVNDGTITATGAPSIVRGVFNYRSAIGLASGSSLTLTNRGTISALGAGIKVESGALSANITNSGTIRATATGADARLMISGLYLDSTTGGTTVSNSGTISGAQYGIYQNSGTMTLTNTGTLSGATGFATGTGAVVNLFNSGTITGTGGTAVDLTAGGAGSVFTLGSGYTLTGLVKGKSTDTFQLGGSGAASFDLSTFGAGQQIQGFTTMNVVGGTWTATGTGGAANVAVLAGTLQVDGTLTATNDIVIASGATLSGIGTITDPTIQSGGTLAPGNAATPYGAMTIGGPLTFQPGSFLNVNINASGQASNVLVNNGGLVTINGGTVQVNAAAGAYNPATRYTLISANAGVAGRFTNATTNAAFLQPLLSYDAANVYLNMGQMSFTTGAATANQVAVGRGLDNGAQQNTNPANALVTALNQISLPQVPGVLDGLSGEGLAGAQTTALRASNLFTNAIFDQATGVGGGNTVTVTETRPGFMSYAAVPEQNVAGLGTMPLKSAPYAQRRTWNVWASGFGAGDSLRGAAPVGTANQTSSIYGGAMGADYQLGESLRIGFAVGGSDARFSVTDRATSGQVTGGSVGLYSMAEAGAYYGAGLTSFAANSNTTTRTVGGFGGLPAETDRGQFSSQVLETRLELGRRHAIGTGEISSFVAVDVAGLRSSRFNETAIAGPGLLALAVADQNAVSTVSEIGLRYKGRIVFGSGMTFIPLIAAAWLHEFTPQRNEAAQFVNLPGSAFLVQGAQAAADSARVKAGGELGLTPQTALFATFNGQFSQATRLYGGSGGMKWRW